MAIKRIDGKETGLSRTQYETELRASTKIQLDRVGELVVDITTNPQIPSLWIANISGYLNPLTGGSLGAFTEITANGTSLLGIDSPTVEFAPAEVEFCGYTQETVGIDVVAPTITTPGTVEFRVTPTGIPIDNPFSANFDMSSTGAVLQQDFTTLGDEVGTYWLWDLQKNPVAGLQCYDLGQLP